jgi:hypothetical protein
MARTRAGIVKRECSIEGCGRPHVARGWCSVHYERWRNQGDPLAAPRRVHGHARANNGMPTPTYYSWQAMRARCYRPGNVSYHHYGGRGVKVCDRWLGPGGFERFLADMGEKPVGMTLDRIDPDGDYEPGNVRWATWAEQARDHAARPASKDALQARARVHAREHLRASGRLAAVPGVQRTNNRGDQFETETHPRRHSGAHRGAGGGIGR